MKSIWIIVVGLALGSAFFLMGQQTATPESQSQVMGRGRGGAAYAWNDKNKVGTCDLTGKPVGQGQAACARRGGRRGRGRGRRCCQCQPQPDSPAPLSRK